MKKAICTLLCVMAMFLFGSTAATAASAQSGDIHISFYSKGDVNRDKKIDKKDSDRLLQYTAGWNMNVTVRNSEADMNADGKIDGLDALLLLQKIG